MNQNITISMQDHYRHSRRFIILLCVAAFGPYLVLRAGLRLDHFVIYGSVLFLLIFKKNVKWNKNIFLLMALFLANLFWVVAVSLRNLSWATPYRLCAALENFTQPVALIIVIYAAIIKLDREARQNLLRVAGVAVILMLCLNSFISILTIFYDTRPFLQYFVTPDDTGFDTGTVMGLAASMGRFSGIFNQPFENGLAYSIGLLVWVYLAVKNKRINSMAWVLLILLIIGGSLSVSKVFIIGGFPLSMLYWFWTALSQSRIRLNNLIGGIIWGLVAVAAIGLLAESWVGLDGLLSLFNLSNINDEGAIYTFTGGRFGAGGIGVKALFAKTWSEAPVMGFGIPLPYPCALDNAFIEFFIYGGMVGLLFYIAILAAIFRIALYGLRTNPEYGRLLMALWILIIGAGMGAPVLTINRASILLWVILVIIFGVLSKRKQLYPETT